MPIITSLIPQKNKKKVNVFLDGKFAFGIDLTNFVKYGLKAGIELSKEKVEEIIKKSESQDAYDKILVFASIRPRTYFEYKTWLKKKNVPESIHQELFNRLKRLNFLDDEKFAIWWVEQRQHFKPKSEKVLKLELQQKGVEKEIIEKVLKESAVDELATAKKILKRKEHLWKRLTGYQKRLKISQYLLRNGYSWDVIRKVIGKVDQES